jgi:two-component system, OmpR family, sensor kinase
MTAAGPTTGRMRAAGTVWAAAPLWLRLVAAVLAMVALALGATGVATVTALHGYLLSQVDGQLRAAGEPIVHGQRHGAGPGLPPLGPGVERGGSGRFRLPSTFSLAITDQTGAVVEVLESPLRIGQPGPVLPQWTPE